MSRFITNGRDAWTPRQARHHNPHFHGALLGMDYPRARKTAWNIISLAVWAVAIAYAAKLWIVG